MRSISIAKNRLVCSVFLLMIGQLSCAHRDLFSTEACFAAGHAEQTFDNYPKNEEEKTTRPGREGITPPQRMPESVVQPEYPDALRKQHIEGKVMLTLAISESGEVVDVDYICGNSALAYQAEQAARQWRFKPAQDSKGNNIAVRLPTPFHFDMCSVRSPLDQACLIWR